MDVRVAGCVGNVVGDVALYVHAEVCPGLVGVVILAVALGEDGAWSEC
jgi:hypothetical protein